MEVRVEVEWGEEDDVEGALLVMEGGVGGGWRRDGDGEVVGFEGGFCRRCELV